MSARVKLAPHVCRESLSCRCSVAGLEPNDDCPVHGYPWPPRCGICSKFLPWPKPDDEASEDEMDPGGEWNRAERLGPNEASHD